MNDIEKKILFFKTELENYTQTFGENAKELDRAYIVFESIVTADLADETKYTHVLTFHAVCQGYGPEVQKKNMRNETTDTPLGKMRVFITDTLKAIKSKWRTTVTEEDKKAKQRAEEESKGPSGSVQIDTTKAQPKKVEEEDDEDTLFEKTKLNWLFRQLYINTREQQQQQQQQQQ